MAGTITITGVSGPGQAVTAAVIPDVVSMNVDMVNNVVQLTLLSGRIRTIGITAATTITATKSGSTYTFTIANA